MHFYSRPSLPRSYLPQSFNHPASYYLNDEPSFAFAFDDSPSSPPFPPQIDTETRYRRALRELKAAEQEFGTYIALEYVRQATLVRQRGAVEAARRERKLSLQAEIQRILNEHARLLRTQVEDKIAQRRRALLRALVDADAEGVPVPQRHFIETRPTRSRPAPPPARCDEEALTVGELLGLPTLHTPSEVQRFAEPQSRPPKHNDAEVALKEFLEFFHDIASQSSSAGGCQPIHRPSAASKPEAIPLNEKAKDTAKAAFVPQATLRLLSERMKGGRGAGDAKKAHASRVVRSSPGASSSEVKIEGSSSSGHAASPARSPTSASIPTPAPQASALQSAFKFPPVLDFDHSDLAISPNNAPVRAYEYALNGLLEQLDAIDGDGDEEIRYARREARADVTPVTKGAQARPVLPSVVLAASADADVIQAISEELRFASPVSEISEVAVAEFRNVTASGAVSSTLERATSEVVFAFADFSDSTATITGPAAPATSPASSSNVSAPASPETFLRSMSHDQLTFPPMPASHASSGSGSAHEDAVLLDDANEGGSVGSMADGWSEVDA
ncbi:hypothetical protein BC826DRAFT_1108354 [Russula brevipes]|nr:hypothetical protein BC826DRAFT_1108354 [Russula brevipes]